MSCINVKVSPVPSDLTVNSFHILEGLNVSLRDISKRVLVNVYRLGEGLGVSLRDVSERVLVNTHRLGEGLSVRCSVICSLVDVAPYLDISPQEIQWITDDTGVFFDVESNVEWIIVTS